LHLLRREPPGSSDQIREFPRTLPNEAELQNGFAEDAAQFSPDGKWIAYESNESGRFEIYAQAFPAAHGKWQVSTAGGTTPRWNSRGTELFYVAPDDSFMAAPIIVGSYG
jgi:Tol biopolymer transport system component